MVYFHILLNSSKACSWKMSLPKLRALQYALDSTPIEETTAQTCASNLCIDTMFEFLLPLYRHPYWPASESSGMPAVTKFLACERTTLSPTDDPASLGEGVIVLHLVHQSMPYKTWPLSLFLLKERRNTDRDVHGEGMNFLLRGPLFTPVFSFSFL